MQDRNIAIKVNKLSKSYKIYGENLSFDNAFFSFLFKKFSNLIKNKRNNTSRKKVRVLKDINFEVKHGEKIGIIGKNGAGKSTLLKIISRITAPDEGRIEINGRVASLLEIGTGFHPDLSGRENIYLNGTLLGMTRKEINRKQAEIIDFAGIPLNYLDTPVKKYSSGMKVRLAFAVAAHLTSEILIVDEVLAVGDVAFQQKCLNKMSEIAKQGRTILFVSHNISALKNLCNRTIYLRDGEIISDGNTEDILKLYLNENLAGNATLSKEAISKALEIEYDNGKHSVELKEINIYGSDLVGRSEFYSDEEIFVDIDLEILKLTNDLRIVLSLEDTENSNLLTSQISDSTEFINNHIQIQPGNYRARCKIPADLLGDNKYYITLNLIHPFVEHLIFRKVISFKVKFKGYNNVQLYSFGNAYMRPVLNWNFSDQNNKSNLNSFNVNYPAFEN